MNMISNPRFAFVKGVFFFLVFICLQTTANAQTTTVEGFVQEENTGEPIIFAHIFFKGTAVGTRSDTTGHFKISIASKDLKVDSLVVTYLAYYTQTIGIKRGTQQKVTIKMRPQFTQLQEF